MKTKTLNPVFAPKHQAYMKRAVRSTISVAEGAVRAGKTIDNIAAFASILQHGTPDRIHLATGSTSANAKLNIGDANGYGLEYIFRGRCRWTKYRGNEALVVKSETGNREYIIIFAGGAKADSFKKVRGNSYGMWIATEINLHHETMIQEAFNRQLAARNRHVFWDLNPSSPGHWIYANYIDCFPEKFGDAYNYEHFTIRDNATITPERLREIEAQYTKGTVWYRRDILGQRCAAEGVIYHSDQDGVLLFADDPDKYIIDEPRNMSFATVSIGVDFGGTGSATKFQATGITRDWKVYALDEEYIKGEIDPAMLNDKFAAFVQRVTRKYGEGHTRADSAEQILIRGLMSTAASRKLATTVKNAIKMQINDRIKLTLLLMAQGRFFVTRKCPHLIDALQTAVYDDKGNRRDDGTSDIDSLDAFEYSIEPYHKQLISAGLRVQA